MNKVVCNLCGTSYPENATQCPICGQVRSADEATENSGSSTYTYVKGGRFSKSNVKKRNRASSMATDSSSPANSDSNSKKKNTGLVVTMIVLLLAIVLVLGYIAAQFFIPKNAINNLTNKPVVTQQEPTKLQETENTAAPTTVPSTSEADLKCKSITVNTKNFEFNELGTTAELTVKLDPADTTDQLFFSSSDGSVATVSSDGVITVVGEGSAVITVSCGTVRAECNVTCEIPEETTSPDDETASFWLNRKEITFNQEGESWLIYDGDIAVEDIIWSSDDSDVATITDGRVVAVGNGDTTVYGFYDNQTVSCIIHCDFSNAGESSGITEAGGITESVSSSGNRYKLYNPVGYADDVTIYVGDQFPLQLVDENENEITGAQWTITDDSICTYVDGIVEATNLGTAEIIATYEGVDYICTIRVIEE